MNEKTERTSQREFSSHRYVTFAGDFDSDFYFPPITFYLFDLFFPTTLLLILLCSARLFVDILKREHLKIKNSVPRVSSEIKTMFCKTECNRQNKLQEFLQKDFHRVDATHLPEKSICPRFFIFCRSRPFYSVFFCRNCIPSRARNFSFRVSSIRSGTGI